MPPSVDGKYITLAQLKAWGIGTVVSNSDPTIYNGSVTNTPDDGILSDCIIWAETKFDELCGVGFEQQSYTLANSFKTFIDRNGWLHLFARERVPVTEVTAVRIRDISSSLPWKTITWDSGDIILPQYETTYPRPESRHVQLIPIPAMYPLATGQVIAQFTYKGGYATIPQSLQGIIARLAWWQYKLREAPVAKVVNMPLGTITVPLNIPPDIVKDVMLWRPVD